MNYQFERFDESRYVYAITVDKKYFFVVFNVAPPIFQNENLSSCILLMNEEEKVVCKACIPFSKAFRDFKKGEDFTKNLLAKLAEQAKKNIDIDFTATFEELRKDYRKSDL